MIAQTDTLVCDTAKIAWWQSQSAYDYNRELITPKIDVFGWLAMQIRKLLRAIFGSQFAEEYTGLVLICITAVILVFLLWVIYKKRPDFFMRSSRHTQLGYNVEQDTIYGVDFRQKISEAIARQDYREAVRLLYLQILKQLSDAGKINWQLYKTPTDYIYELKSESLRAPFRELTNRFLKVRYGNFEATDALFCQMEELQKALLKGGEE